MTVEVAAIQENFPAVRVQDMDRPSALDPLRRMAFVGYNRLYQAASTLVVRRGVRLMETDPAGFQAYLQRTRAGYMRHDRPHIAALQEAEAVRSHGPALGLPAPPVPADWFAPKQGEPRGFVFYVHGGSFICERSPRITAMVARFAAAAGARVFAPNYRLAPEHPCPAAVEDIVAAFRWLKLQFPDEPVVALAESAGAAILLAALQQLRDLGEAMPEAILLLSPWVDLSLQSWSVIAAGLAGTSPYTMESMAVMAHLYLDGRSPTDPVASPMFGSFLGFPPMLIHAAKSDIMYDDAVRLAERVREARGDLTLRLWTTETHVWERLPGVNSRRSVQLGAEFIRRHLQ